jgi:hypothetical protein
MSAFGSPHEDNGDVDREIRIEKMKRELEELSSESMISGSFGDVSPELEEIFLERVCEFEKAELDTNFNRLVQRGVGMVRLRNWMIRICARNFRKCYARLLRSVAFYKTQII